MSYDKLKKQLIKLAKDETLPYAYILNCGSNGDYKLYQVDLKTGDEKLAEGVNLSGNLDDIRLLRRVFAVENIEDIYNYNECSYILPHSILLEDVDISSQGIPNPAPYIVKRPD